MSFLAGILDLFCKVVYLFVFFCGLLGVLGLARWSADATKRAKRKRKAARTAVFGGWGQSLGRASAVDLKAARVARIANNRLQMQAIMAKEAKRQQRKPVRADPPRSPPPSREYSSFEDAASTSPRSVTEAQTLMLPKELQPDSMAHFFMDGATKFIVLPTMPNSEVAIATMKRIAREFMPIIRKHGFNVRSVSEMCCCGDGLEYELGGERRSVPAGETIVGNSHDTVAGYNGKLFNHFGRAEHVIHLRLRTVDNHQKFMEYDEIVDTMAHELAHCVHEDHGPDFWDLMEDILADRAKIEADSLNGARVRCDPVTASKNQFGGFNIYQSIAGQMRNWNGQVKKTQMQR
jgi:hypothetical protein